MKNTKTNFSKAKLAARVMIVVLFLASTVSLISCNLKSEVDNKKRFNLNNGGINFLCISNLSSSREAWNDGYCRGVYIAEGNEIYERPYITYSTTIVDDDLGDGRTFYEKYIKKYFSFSGSPKYSMEIFVDSYAFQGDIEDLRYEFDTYYSKGENIRIYNNNELIAKMSVITTLKMPEEFYTEILDKKLFTITVDKYLLTELGETAPKEEPMNIPPSLTDTELSYLTIRDLRNSNGEIILNDYVSNFHGGFSSIDWQTGYEPVKNENKLNFFVSSINAHIQLEAEFYEYREKMGKIEYVFENDSKNGDFVELYSQSILVGKVFYSSNIEISENWLKDFFNENLVVINIKK